MTAQNVRLDVAVIERAVIAMWKLAHSLPSGDLDGRDKAAMYVSRGVADDAMHACMVGMRLLGVFPEEDPPDGNVGLDEIGRLCDRLVSMSGASLEFELMDLVGRIADVHRGMKRLELDA